MRNQRTSSGLSHQIGRMAEDATRKYPGGTERAELAKGHPDFGSRFHALLDRLAADRLPIAQRLAWRTIQLGTGLKSAESFVNAIQKAGGEVSDNSEDIMSREAFTVANRPAQLDLVIVTTAELFRPAATRGQIYGKAISLGLSLCPAETGPQLRLQYPDQPSGEQRLIAMVPIADSSGYLHVFCVENGDIGPSLSTEYGRPDLVWNDRSRWVFCRKSEKEKEVV